MQDTQTKPHDYATMLYAQAQSCFSTQKLPKDFDKAIHLIEKTTGRLVICGVGKSSFIAQKINANFHALHVASTYLHAGEALHGDLGLLYPNDVLIMLSHSCKSSECLAVWNYAEHMGIPRILITQAQTSTMARSADALLDYTVTELCTWNRLPTMSSQIMLLWGDLLCITLQKRIGLREADYLKRHPGGLHGLDARRIEHLYDPKDATPIVEATSSLRDTLIHIQTFKKGCAIVADTTNAVLGIFTDGDLRRALLHEAKLDDPISTWMTPHPVSLTPEMTVGQVRDLFHNKRITAAPVCDKDSKILGLLDQFHLG